MKFFGILCAVKAYAIATTFTFGGNPVVSSKGTSYFNDMLGPAGSVPLRSSCQWVHVWDA